MLEEGKPLVRPAPAKPGTDPSKAQQQQQQQQHQQQVSQYYLANKT